ncbi:MAG: 3-oxoacyl-(acyl-carrier-protein) synthase, partial [Halothiobacillaceae bacterium]
MGGKRRVVVTGVGMVGPVGLNVVDSWSNIVAGRGGIGPITHFDTHDFSVRFGGSVWGFDVNNH